MRALIVLVVIVRLLRDCEADCEGSEVSVVRKATLLLFRRVKFFVQQMQQKVDVDFCFTVFSSDNLLVRNQIVIVKKRKTIQKSHEISTFLVRRRNDLRTAFEVSLEELFAL